MSRPSLAHRIRDTLKYFQNGYSSNNRLVTKKSPFIWPFGFGNKPQWSMVDYNSFYTDGFNLNAVIYAVIMVKVRALAQVNLVAARGSVDEPEIIPSDEKNELSDLLDRPNTYQSGSEFSQVQEVFLNTTGNAFTFLERSNRNQLPKAIWPLNPVNIQIIPTDSGEIKGYLYNPQGRLNENSLPILPENMMHVKLPNPSDPLQGLGFGLSPIQPMAQSGDVDNNITEFLKMFFQHGAMPTGALKLEDMTLDDDSVAEIKEKWMEIYGGSSNWSDIAVLDSTMSYEKIGMSFKEMDFTVIDQRNESRIMLPFGVPAELLPIRLGLEGSTFANKEEARRWFWEDTMTYELDLFLDTYKAYLTTDNGVFPIFDTSKVHALKKDISKLVNSAKELWTMGVPAKIAYTTVGLPVPDYPGNDIGYLPFNIMPVLPSGEMTTPQDNTNNSNDNDDSTEDSSQNETDDENTKQVKKNSRWDEDQRKIAYKAFDNIATNHEKPFGKAAINALEHDKRNVLAVVQSNKKKSLVQKASVNYPAIETEISNYLFGEARENWRKEFTPVMLAEIEDTGKFWSAQLGVQFDIRNVESEDWFTSYTTVFANPITETSNEIVHDVLAQAQAEGWSNDEIANKFDDIFDVWLTGDIDPIDFEWLTNPAANPNLGNRLLHWRKELIARTETTRMANAGAFNLYRGWGVTGKSWLDSGDDGRTRDSHLNMAKRTVKINEKFVTGAGNELEYPGDSNAPLSETAQCRCTILPEFN